MKKVLTIAVLAFALAACCTKEAGLSVDKFYENPTEYVGTEITITGAAKICCCSGALLLTGSEKNAITVIPAEGVVVPDSVKGSALKVTGIISEEVIDEAYVATLIEKATAEQDSVGLAKAEKITAAIAEKGVIRNYTIAATAIEKVAGCCKDEKESCEKEGEEGHTHAEGEECNGHNHDAQTSEAAPEGCAKKCCGGAAKS